MSRFETGSTSVVAAHASCMWLMRRGVGVFCFYISFAFAAGIGILNQIAC
jgi:hypothetical protein